MKRLLRYFGLILLSSGSIAAQAQLETGRMDCLIEPHMLIDVGSPVWGIIENMPVERGDLVKKGQVLAVLDNEIERVTVQLSKLRSRYLEDQYIRLQSLKSRSLASAQSIDEAATEMNMAKVELEKNELLLKQKTITSPVEGVVIERLLSPGEYAYEQAAVVKVAQTNKLNVEVLLPITYFGKVTKGMKAEVFPEVPVGGKHIAEVTVIDHVMDAASATFGVRLNLDNPDHQIPAGLKCQLQFMDTDLIVGNELNTAP